jgi:protein SCO1/2
MVRNKNVTARIWHFIYAFLILNSAAIAAEPTVAGATNIFSANGLVKEIKADGQTLVVQHEAIPNFMEAMTMPFRVKDSKTVKGIAPGTRINFQLFVTPTESWIDEVKVTGAGGPAAQGGSKPEPKASAGTVRRDFHFTNELGQAVSLADFQGQALAMTFFFTRCPIPEYCPRLSKNFAEASKKLAAMPGAPTNWHFLSITFDPEHDTPGALRTYGRIYDYDGRYWSFLTADRETTDALARMFGFRFQADGALFNHDFRTVIVDAAGKVQMIYPIGGNLSDSIVQEMLKAVQARPAEGPR